MRAGAVPHLDVVDVGGVPDPGLDQALDQLAVLSQPDVVEEDPLRTQALQFQGNGLRLVTAQVQPVAQDGEAQLTKGQFASDGQQRNEQDGGDGEGPHRFPSHRRHESITKVVRKGAHLIPGIRPDFPIIRLRRCTALR
jgi:hypothetical protein